MKDLPAAEKMPYWKTSSASADTWMDKTERLIQQHGGLVLGRVAARLNGKSAIMFHFKMMGDDFRITWPALPTRKPEDNSAALRQAATMVYHDTKARVMRCSIFPARVVFSDWLVLGNGQTVAQIGQDAVPEALRLLTT